MKIGSATKLLASARRAAPRRRLARPSGGLTGSRLDRFPGLTDQDLEFALRDSLEIHDDVGSLAPHEFHEGLGVGFEEEFLLLFGKVQLEDSRSHHREGALLCAETGTPEVNDFGHAMECERDTAHVGRGWHRLSLTNTVPLKKQGLEIH